ncbi:MAG: hypothetical protein D6761_06945 [Candidatus Dadabacteria bacterium]|nr:MAG: hypothetical protein D6761_06945 [Candidatus Dadabacteria bacterium]
MLIIALLALPAAQGCTFTGNAKRFAEPRPIPIRYGYRTTPKLIGEPRPTRALLPDRVAHHPWLSDSAGSNMHVDGRATDRTPLAGPVGIEPEVASRALGVLGGQCASANFDRHGHILAVCVNFTRPRLLMIDPESLAVLARLDLPKRIARSPFSIRKIVSDTSGGAYFVIDREDRVVLATSENDILRITHEDVDGRPVFRIVDRFDARAAVAAASVDADDRITAVIPDWDGRLWFVTRHGVIGTVTPETGQIRTISLGHEEIQNSFAVARDGVYVVSDHALYRLMADHDGRPDVLWRTRYDRGVRHKPGMIGQGSGTTPTLVGDHYVAIADNADPRMNVLVYDRTAPGSRLICKVPVFEPGRSATENSLVSYGNSLIVENNYGYRTFMTMTRGKSSEPGIWRVDFDPETEQCTVVWKSQETSPTTVPKLSEANGLLYVYTKNPDHWRLIDAFYLTAIDFHTGETVFKVLTGTGMKFDNNWAAISIGPDGSAWIGTLNGLVRVRDRITPVRVANERRERRHQRRLDRGGDRTPG